MATFLDFDPPLEPPGDELPLSEGLAPRARPRSVVRVARLSVSSPGEPVADATSHSIKRLLQHVQRQPDMRLSEQDAAETFGGRVVRRATECGLIDVDADSEAFWTERLLYLTSEGEAWLNRQRLLSAITRPFRAVEHASAMVGDLWSGQVRS